MSLQLLREKSHFNSSLEAAPTCKYRKDLPYPSDSTIIGLLNKSTKIVVLFLYCNEFTELFVYLLLNN